MARLGRAIYDFSLAPQEPATESHALPSMAKGLKFLYLICRKPGRGRGT
jgi:hypothetical protein